MYKNNFIFLICLTFFILMSNGYGLLEEKLKIIGETTINVEDNEKQKIKPEVKFEKTDQIGNNIFFYNIIIYNNSNISYHNWQIKIKDTEYISYPYSIDGERTDDSWILTNYNWDERIESGEKIYISIIFEVSSQKPNELSIEDYVQYFLNNSIEVTCLSTEEDREGIIIKNGNARLTIKESEIEVKDFNIQIDQSYIVENPNEKMYIITINNDTNKNYINIRGNIYLGTNNKILEVSPSEITCDHITNVTFILPQWVQLQKNSSLVIYVIIDKAEENFIPDIVLSATIKP